MGVLHYDWDALIRRLRARGCVVTRKDFGMSRRHGVIEYFSVELNGVTRTLQVGPSDENPTTTVVRSLCDGLGLSYDGFDLLGWPR